MKKTKVSAREASPAKGSAANDSRSQRYQELRTILEDRRREIQSEVQSRMKDVRADAGMVGVVDDVETSESDIQDEIEFALIQMKAETLHRINEALERLEEGTYGRCFECGDEIGPQRLRALPFAARTARKPGKSRRSASACCPAGPPGSVSTCPTNGRRAGPSCYHLPAPRTHAEPAFHFLPVSGFSRPNVRCPLHLGSSGYAGGGPERLRTPRVHTPTGASL
jgi:RNA polymerase-binding protein DksA